MFNFTFKKIFNTAKELMKITNLPESTFYKFQNEWISKGGDPKEMGKVEVSGGPILWNSPKYVEWLIEYKINKPARFNYEIKDKKISEKTLLFINNNKKEQSKNGR